MMQRSANGGGDRGWIAAAVLGLCLALAPVAAAQPGGGGGGDRRGGMRFVGGGMGGGMFGGRDAFEPPVQSEQLERYAGMLGLDADQKMAAQALLEAQIGEFTPAARAAREKMEAVRESFRETRDQSVFRDMGDVMEQLRQKRTTVERRFFDDLRSLLTREQAERFGAVERTHRRETTIERGLMSGERVDLVRLVDGLSLSEQQKADLRPVLEQYELELDRELQRRNEMYEQAMTAMREATAGGAGGGGPGAFMTMFEDPKMQELFEKGREASIRVRDTNRKFARQVEAALPPDAQSRFESEFRRTSFPMIYRPTYASRVMDAAEKLDGLSDAQRQSLQALRESFTRDLEASNTAMEQAQQEAELTWSPATMMRGGDEKVNALRRSRREMLETAVEKIRGVLSEEQQAKLPERGDGEDDREDGDRPRRRGRDRGPE